MQSNIMPMPKNKMAGRMPGVIKVIDPDAKNYYNAADVMRLLGIGRSKAYELISACREEMISSGQLIPDYPSGRIPKKYFNTRCCIDE